MISWKKYFPLLKINKTNNNNSLCTLIRSPTKQRPKKIKTKLFQPIQATITNQKQIS